MYLENVARGISGNALRETAMRTRIWHRGLHWHYLGVCTNDFVLLATIWSSKYNVVMHCLLLLTHSNIITQSYFEFVLSFYHFINILNFYLLVGLCELYLLPYWLLFNQISFIQVFHLKSWFVSSRVIFGMFCLDLRFSIAVVYIPCRITLNF